jgi:hypothetical protein
MEQEASAEAAGIVKMVRRGVLTAESARELISVSEAQSVGLRNLMGPLGELVVEGRRRTLKQFERLLGDRASRTGNHE